jgi:hypothetical protein
MQEGRTRIARSETADEQNLLRIGMEDISGPPLGKGLLEKRV